MMDVAGNINKVYTVNNDSSLLNNVTKAICVLLPDSFILGGLNDKGKVFIINHFENPGTPGDNSYLEPIFQNKSLHKLFKAVTTVFVGYNKQLLVPKSLYSSADAEKWMQQLYFIEADDVILSQRMKDDKTQNLFSIRADVKELLEQNLDKPKILPLAAYQFHKNISIEHMLQCCITRTQAYATLYKNRQLCWHQVFDYANAEDIAYKLKLAMQEHGLTEEVKLDCTITDNALTGLVAQLSAYFPAFEDGSTRVENGNDWTGIIYLLQQLHTCA